MTRTSLHDVQDAHWEQADPAHFAWTTRDPGFAPVEDALPLPYAGFDTIERPGPLVRIYRWSPTP